MNSRKKIDGDSGKRSPQKSVKGLENLKSLVLPVMLAQKVAPAEQPKREGADAIIAKTVAKLAEGTAASPKYLAPIIAAMVREAVNLGHAMAVGQNDMIEDLLAKQYKARTDLTMPVVIAAVMEQLGMQEMMIDLDTLATVFSRCRIEQNMLESDDHNAIIYKLRYLADDDEGAGDKSFALAP